ncbi:MAG: two-component system, sensor histidine kinase and response regulator, partial [Microbacteriaceae bacterium]|nr:two-component system, sensor histidine kinase and response regulator [Microbacteriaceae bacterium]
ATNGAEAVAAVESTSYQVVLMDCHMPVMDGFDATAAIRGLAGEASRVPIIAMTAGAQDADRQRCLEAGMDDFLSKPVDLSALKEALMRWVPADANPHIDLTGPWVGARTAPAPASGRDAPTAGPDAPALDRVRLDLLRSLGAAVDHGILPEAVDAFRSEVPASLTALDLAIARGDVTAVKGAAHKLKGGAANVGAAGAVALCAQLETLALADDGGRIRELVSQLEVELTRVGAALDQALDTPS